MSPAIRRAVAQIAGVDAEHTADAIAIIRRVMGGTPEGIAALALLEAAPANEPAPESGPRLEVLDLRASRMPIAFACPGSIRRPALRINETGEAAELGTAAHVLLRSVAAGMGPQYDRVPEVAAEFRCDPEELRMLLALGTKLWAGVAESFPNAMTEVPMSLELTTGHTLTGSADIVSVSPGTIRIADWKTGRKDSDYLHQLRGYATLALATDDSLKVATATILWVRDQEIENLTLTRSDAVHWLDDLCEKVIAWDGVYRPGAHCTYCQRAHECDARSALVRRSIADVMGTDPGATLATMTAEQILDLHEKLAVITPVAKKLHEAIKDHVEQNGDVVANGHRLTIAVENRRKLETLLAYEILSGSPFEFGDAEWAECMEIKLSKAESLVKTKAGRGRGAAAVRELTTKLEDAEAIKLAEVRKLVTRRG